MYEEEKKQILDYGKKLDKYGLIALSGGNISLRTKDGNILVTPSGMIYDEMVPSDILLVDITGNILEGERKPSVDTIALCYIYQHLKNVNSIIHTHQPFATGIGLVTDEIPCYLTTLANTVKGSVNVAPYSSAASVDMGKAVVENIGNKLAVVLRNHGVIAVGKSLHEALYSAVYLEEGAKTLFVAKSTGSDLHKLSQEQIDVAVEVFNHYGQ
ncbi:class II aldolase/adducin family protein [Ligilactobacillus acidipiscis]|uniref:class II aldolase/adducin family protein n=1 Tax=Ligilactobacillus acidipiscis TaxID=89059 RepID=UPI0023F64B26|nr:class II aldolase/adducin family protein [Ligilactobacillus acidipiscis]WEV56524.1 class II aldolase/adducin family protein [Ligilactobacillus acidipiscis]